MRTHPLLDTTHLMVQDGLNTQALTDARMVIQQEFLDHALELPVIRFADAGIRPLCRSDTVRVFNITKVVYNHREDALTNLLNVYSSFGHDYGLSLIIQSDSGTTSLYLAVRSYFQKKQAFDGGEILTQALEGHFPGTSIELLSNEAAHALLGYATPQEERTAAGFKQHARESNWGLSAAVAVPGAKDNANISFTQGIERLMDAMEGKTYTAVIIAEPCSKQDIAIVQHGYEAMLSQLSTIGKQQVTISESHNQTLSFATSETFATSLMDSLSQTQTHTVGKASTMTRAVAHSEFTSDTVASTTSESATKAVSVSSSLSHGPISTSVTGVIATTKTTSATESHTSTQGVTTTSAQASTTQHSVSSGATCNTATSVEAGKSSTETSAATVGIGTSTIIERRDVHVERLMDKIESHLERIDSIRALGAWTAGAFFIAPEAETAATAASIYLGTLRGEATELGNATIIRWGNSTAHNRALALESLCELTIPRLLFTSTPEKDIIVLPTALVSSKELALMMNLPRLSVRGVNVMDGVSFGREVRRLKPRDPADRKTSITIGNVYHLFRERSTAIELSRNDFSRHVLVTGTTGTGKTTAIQHILRQLHAQSVPFLVLEPAKTEYGKLANLGFADRPVHVFNVGKYGPDCLRLNPLVFPQSGGITLMEHIDRLCALFNAAFPMYAAMPQVLEAAVVHAYEKCGWDITTSTYMGNTPSPQFPTLRNVANEIEGIVAEAGFAGEAKSTYIGALKTRITSLMRGSLGMTFGAGSTEETPPERLFDQSCIVNLSALGSPEKKAIVMGLLLIRLQEYRVSGVPPQDDRLRHLMVVEEAHNLLKSAAGAANMELANPRGQAVEYFANLIAEMRAYGQGFLIADQSASALDPSVQRNTNTKIVFCAPYEADREILAGTLSLDAEQKKALARLESQTAIVKQNDWADAVQCRIHVGDLFTTLQDGYCRGQQAITPPTEKKAQLAASALHCLLSRLSIRQDEGRSRLNAFILDVKEQASLSEDELATWEQIAHADSLDRLSQDDLGRALYAIWPLNKLVREAFYNTDTAEGLLNRLRSSLMELTDMTPYTPEATRTLLTLLLAPCASHPRYAQAVNLIAKGGSIWPIQS